MMYDYGESTESINALKRTNDLISVFNTSKSTYEYPLILKLA